MNKLLPILLVVVLSGCGGNNQKSTNTKFVMPDELKEKESEFVLPRELQDDRERRLKALEDEVFRMKMEQLKRDAN